MITRRPRICAFLAVLGDGVGLAVGGHHAHLVADARAPRAPCAAFSISSMSDFEPMMIADARRVDVELLELGLGRSVSRRCGRRAAGCSLIRALHGPQRDVATQLPTLEGDQVGGSIRGVPGGAGVRRPSAVTLSTRPPAVTIAPSAPRRAGVRDLDVAARHVVEPVITSPVDERRRVAGARQHDA